MQRQCALLLAGLWCLAGGCGTDTTEQTNPAFAGAAGSSGGAQPSSSGAGGKAPGSGAGAGAGAGAAPTGGFAAAAGASAAGEGGSAAEAGNGNVGGEAPLPTCEPWPDATETLELTETLEVGGTLDGGLKRYVGAGELGGDGQDEDMPPLLQLANGAVLKNLIIGKPASDGIHCAGTCYLQNVWWEDVGEDAATFEGGDADQVMTVECAGARLASDKVFQHNGAGTVVLRDVYVEEFGKLYRSCGNCSQQYERHVQLIDVHATDGDLLVGINETYGDTATFTNVTLGSDITVCSRYAANDTGDEPERTGSGADPVHCHYEASDIHGP